MPNAHNPAPRWTTAPKKARRTALAIAAYSMPSDRSLDAGIGQRVALRRQSHETHTGPAVAQRTSANPSAPWVDATAPPMTMPPAIGIDSIDPTAGISSHGAGRAARILGAKTRAPVKARTGAVPIDPVAVAERMPDA